MARDENDHDDDGDSRRTKRGASVFVFKRNFVKRLKEEEQQEQRIG